MAQRPPAPVIPILGRREIKVVEKIVRVPVLDLAKAARILAAVEAAMRAEGIDDERIARVMDRGLACVAKEGTEP